MSDSVRQSNSSSGKPVRSGFRRPPTKQVRSTCPSGARPSKSDDEKSAPRMVTSRSTNGTRNPKPSSEWPTAAAGYPRCTVASGGWTISMTCVGIRTGLSAGKHRGGAAHTRLLQSKDADGECTRQTSSTGSMSVTGVDSRTLSPSRSWRAVVSSDSPPGKLNIFHLGGGRALRSFRVLNAPRINEPPASSSAFIWGKACRIDSLSGSPEWTPETNGSTA